MDAVNALVRDAVEKAGEGVEDDSGTDDDPWDGIEEAQRVDHEEEFIDEDRYTTVTVEAVDVSKDGLHKIIQKGEEAGDESESIAVGRAVPNTDQDAKRVWTKERPGGPKKKKKKKKKKKFRYESKADRKLTRYKERSGNKSKAKARKE